MKQAHDDHVETYGRGLAASAEKRPQFIGFALARWREDNQGLTVEDHLGCGSDAVWRLAVAPRPPAERSFVEAIMRLAVAHGANPTALVRMVRRADALAAMQGADGDGMLKAALDADTIPEA